MPSEQKKLKKAMRDVNEGRGVGRRFAFNHRTGRVEAVDPNVGSASSPDHFSIGGEDATMGQADGAAQPPTEGDAASAQRDAAGKTSALRRAMRVIHKGQTTRLTYNPEKGRVEAIDEPNEKADPAGSLSLDMMDAHVD